MAVAPTATSGPRSLGLISRDYFQSRTINQYVTAAGALMLGLYVGRAIALGNHLVAAFLAVAPVLVVLWDRITVSGWCILLLIATIGARGPVAVVDLPPIFNFLHYPLLMGMCLSALLKPKSLGRNVPGRWLVGFLIVTVLSLVAGFSHPLRAALFILIAAEPLVVIWAIHRLSPDAQAMRTVALAAGALMAIQLPWGLWQGLTLGFGDHVQGTLTTHGAGHHILGALFAVVLFVTSAAVVLKRITLKIAVLAIVISFGMMLATAATAVTILGALAAVVAPFVAVPRAARNVNVSLGWGFRIGAAAVAIPLAVFALFWVPKRIGRFEERVQVLAQAERSPEVRLIEERLADPLALLFGSGPGTTSSRASILLALPPGDSPVGWVGLPPTKLGIEYAYGTRDAYGGSAESYSSGMLGIIGDLGFVGFAAFGALCISIWRNVGRHVSVAGVAVRASLLMILSLLFLDNWLEYPEFAIPWAILVAFALLEPFDRSFPAARPTDPQ
jgi:hypothetical protein